jgi:Flp pilus assembly pilin Flp
VIGMLRVFKNFLKEEDGLGTVEIVIITAVLVAVALIFRKYIISFVEDILKSIFGDDKKKQIKDVIPSP